MSGPPAVTVAMAGAGLDGPIAAALTCLLALSLAGLFATGALQFPADLIYTVPLLGGSLGLAVFCAVRSRLASHESVLRWDGQNWFWSRHNDDGVRAVQCVMDLQVGMLLRMQSPEGACEWIWLLRKDHVKHWFALRRVLIFDAVSADDRPVAVHRE